MNRGPGVEKSGCDLTGVRGQPGVSGGRDGGAHRHRAVQLHGQGDRGRNEPHRDWVV